MRLALLTFCALAAIFVGVALTPSAAPAAPSLARVTSTDVTPTTPEPPISYPTDTPLPIGYLPPSSGPYPAPAGVAAQSAPRLLYFPAVR